MNKAATAVLCTAIMIGGIGGILYGIGHVKSPYQSTPAPAPAQIYPDQATESPSDPAPSFDEGVSQLYQAIDAASAYREKSEAERGATVIENEPPENESPVEPEIASKPQPVSPAPNRFGAEAQGSLYFKASDCHIQYKRHSTGTDDEGNRILYYYCDFTNDSDGPLSLSGSGLILNCFQNGIQCATYLVFDDDGRTSTSTDILPGITMEVCVGFRISDDSNCTIVASDMLGALNGIKDATQELSLR